jgi:adenylosuccinate lyase
MQLDAPDLHASQLTALSPLDGRYGLRLSTLASYFSESALIKQRVRVELVIFKQFLRVTKEARLSTAEVRLLDDLVDTFSLKDAARVKEVENTTHHDVKAIEYFLKEKLAQTSLAEYLRFIHFGVTSEDINNLAYRVMAQTAHREVLLPEVRRVLGALVDFAEQHVALPMLARTHGQPAIPTTLGKEISVFCMRILRQVQHLDRQELTGKLNGAVGGYQALQLTYPNVDWLAFSECVTAELELGVTHHTTQIAPPDDIVELLTVYHHLNSILLDLNQDIWRYISDNWLVQKGKSEHVGSSTMPQKVNPIEFENSEGNLVLAIGLIETFQRKLPISRLQRDLSESTMVRSYGVIFGHCLLGLQSLLRGLATIEPNREQIAQDLHANWNILSEAAQVIARQSGDDQGYEHAAKQFKQQEIKQPEWQSAVASINTPVQSLHALTPDTYTGLCVALTHQVVTTITKYLQEQSDAESA